LVKYSFPQINILQPVVHAVAQMLRGCFHKTVMPPKEEPSFLPEPFPAAHASLVFPDDEILDPDRVSKKATHTPSQKEALADEYLKSGERNFDLQDFHKFLVKKFNLESYWKIVGIF